MKRGSSPAPGHSRTPPAASSRRGRTTRIVLVVVALACTIYGTRGLLASHASSRTGIERFDGLARAAALVPENFAYFQELGDMIAALGQHETAEDLYRRALSNNPACSRCWIGLAETLSARGADASTALEKAVATGRSEAPVRLRAGVLYARQGRHVEAGREFVAGQRGMRADRQRFFSFLHRLYDVDFLAERVVRDEDLGRWFSYVRRNRPLDEARIVWARYRRIAPEKAAARRAEFAKALLDAGQVREAWEVRFSGDDALPHGILDGGFEADAEAYRPFGWIVANADGVGARVVDCEDCPGRGRALHLRFDGKHNPRYGGVWQQVPVEPGGAYVLKARVKAKHVTSASGPRLVVRPSPRPGVECRLWATTPEWKLSFGWEEVELPFTAPPECDGVRVMVWRASSDRFNKFLGGEVWMDDVRLEPARGATEESRSAEERAT